jgi:Flp pilus assembly protein TadD
MRFAEMLAGSLYRISGRGRGVRASAAQGRYGRQSRTAPSSQPSPADAGEGAILRSGLVFALCLAVSGCSLLSEAMYRWTPRIARPEYKPSNLPPYASAASAPAAAASATVVAKAPAAARVPETPVDPLTQRAFDEACQALAAGRLEQAEKGFKALTQSHPELGGPHANLGLIYRQAGKLDQAQAEFEQAVKANPRQPVFHNQLGITYRQQGQFAKAREAYERAIELDPANASAHLNLGILHDLYLSDGARALELYDRYLSLSPEGDAKVAKWVADLKNRKPRQVGAATRKEKE